MFRKDPLVVFDSEWTSRPGFRESQWRQSGHYREIVQIGAVKLATTNSLRETDSFQMLVLPRKNPQLSDYFINLTGINQKMVDENCTFHGISPPHLFDNAITIRRELFSHRHR